MTHIYLSLPRLDLTEKIFVGLSLSLFLWTLYLVLFSVRAGLSKVPGPWHARYVNVWMAYKAWRYSSAEGRYTFYKELQTRYGDVVRTGPKTVVVLDPAAVPAIYGVRARLNKGPAYNAFRLGGENRSLLTISDETTHAKYKRLVSNAYSMSSMKAYEPYVDEMVGKFVGVLDRFATTGERINLSRWCHYCWSNCPITTAQPSRANECMLTCSIRLLRCRLQNHAGKGARVPRWKRRT